MNPIPTAGRSLLAVLAGGAVGLLAACGSGLPPKAFPGGDPYDVAVETMDTGGMGPAPVADPKPARRVILPEDARQRQGLTLTTSMQTTTVTAGTPLRVRVIVRNTTRNNARLRYNTAKRFDLFVFTEPKSQNPVFIWSEGQTFPTDYSEHVIDSGSNITRILEIPTTRSADVRRMLENDLTAPLGPGKYYLWATHEADIYLADGPHEITIVDPDAPAPAAAPTSP